MIDNKVRLGEVTDIKTGKLDVNSHDIGGKYPFFTCARKQYQINEYAYDTECVLVAGNGHLNVKYYNGKFNAYQRTYIVEPTDSLDARYLYYFLDSYIEYLRNNAIGGVIKYIKLGNLTDARIPLPPLKTQKRIVVLLDKAHALIDKRKEQIALMDQLIQSLFYDMFGDPVTNPKGWECGPTIKYATSIVPGRNKPKSFTGYIPWITTDDLNHLGRTVFSKKKLGLTDSEIKQVKAKVIPKSSVIMTCVGDLGIVSINDCEMVVNQQLHAFICDIGVLNPTFLMYNLSCQKPYMYKMASSTTVPYMNKTVANNTPTVVPPIYIQTTFADRVQKIEIQKETMTASLKELQNNFNALMQRAFKGEL